MWRRGPPSIARRLFLSSAAACVVVLTVAGLVLTALYRDNAQAALDDQLGVYLRALVADIAMSRDESNDASQLAEPQFDLPFSGWYWQITRIDISPPEIRASRSLFASRLPRLKESDADRDQDGRRRGNVTGPGDKPLRMLEREINAGDQGRFLVQVAATTQSVDRQVREFAVDLGFTFLILALLLVAAMALQVRFGLRPLRRLRRGVVAVRRGQAEAVSGAFPQEVAPLAEELNLLIAANREIVERARIQVGNLAHALKTPLSVIVNEADAEDSALARKVSEQAEVMRDQVKFYLDRARAATRARAIGASADPAAALAGMARAFAKIYPGIELKVDCPPNLRFRGEGQDFDDMAGNLIDNACKWARGAARVAAEPLASGGGDRAFFRLTIDDDGPGLPADRREEALRRGQRLDESKPGSGLGLAIVSDLAAAYGGRLELSDSPLGGLRAVLILPALPRD
ncbi:sensor histidine kinase [Rhodoblastus acidophilus]|uniref:histidine kinase n=1 Tax=Candidatus Rhodoblastus alkanivorans TaxID=2954117 RepID=A0ABS9Z609_9HYPH|nr:sensor histidine kinase [Candidatus Rhodoblastus alkanivorans]MCI4680534.1 sensor histidine kinase [Candidatus Rhodoblastus alkanivorans]MCI4682815.1 sensor histidine kinase [Candidatus Rhodoblastus alkanivorans]MDI4640124.1 sensor histidine kinase [Rhodoblastus acidophilus]